MHVSHLIMGTLYKHNLDNIDDNLINFAKLSIPIIMFLRCCDIISCFCFLCINFMALLHTWKEYQAHNEYKWNGGMDF